LSEGSFVKSVTEDLTPLLAETEPDLVISNNCNWIANCRTAHHHAASPRPGSALLARKLVICGRKVKVSLYLAGAVLVQY
jgi:hypothetical protein